MPHPRPVVLLIDPANRLDPLLADHPALADLIILQVTGPLGADLTEVTQEHVRVHQRVAVVLDFPPPYAPAWGLLVRLRQVDHMQKRSIIFTTDQRATVPRVGGALVGCCSWPWWCRPMVSGSRRWCGGYGRSCSEPIRRRTNAAWR